MFMKKKNIIRIKKYLNRGLRNPRTALKAANWINWQQTTRIGYRPWNYCDEFIEDSEGYCVHAPMPKPSNEGWNGKLRLCAAYTIWDDDIIFGGSYSICGIRSPKAYGEVRHVHDSDIVYYKTENWAEFYQKRDEWYGS